MTTTTEIRSMTPADARRAICRNMEIAIKAGTDAVVEVCMMAQADSWCISGAPADVQKAHAVLKKANMTRERIEHDEELGETFAYYRSR